MKIKLMKSSLVVLGLLFAGETIHGLDFQVVLKGVNDVKSNADQFTDAFNKAKIELATAQTTLKNKSISAKDKALVAVRALVDSIDTLYLFLKTIETLDTALIAAGIPVASDKINTEVKPQIDKIMKIAFMIKGATNALNTLIPKK